MSRSQARALLLTLVFASAALPGVLAHEEERHVEPGRDTETGESLAPNEGYTGPGREPYVSFLEGVWLYGQASVTPLGANTPRHIRGHGDWLVWEDSSRGDIYAYSVSAGTGYYLTTDAHTQRNPDIWGDVVVYEEHRPQGVDVYAHFLETGETRPLATGPGSQRRPSIHGDLVAWEDDRGRTWDIRALRLGDEAGEFPVQVGPDRETDPLVLDGIVYYRTYRFNVWDVHAYDVERNETFQITSDVQIQAAPFTNGRDVLFLTQHQATSWRLDRYDPVYDRVFPVNVRVGDATPISASGDHLLQQSRDVTHIQLVARNLTTGGSQHVSGNLALVTDPLLMGRTAFAAVKTANGTSLLALEVSPFAFGKRPSLGITSPARGVSSWVRPIVVQGTLDTGPGWTEPVTFTYRVDGGPPQAIPPESAWRVTLDPSGYEQGTHRVLFRATFREGPPIEASVMLIVPEAMTNVDVGELGPRYHAAKAMAALDFYVLDNPASWLLIPLALVLLALALVRLWILLRPKRDVVVAEYVPQDDPYL